MMPKDTNAHGTIFGGVILSYIDQAGAVEAKRHGAQFLVTVAMREVVFHEPVNVGDLVSFYTRLVKIGRTSITVSVEVFSQTGEGIGEPRQGDGGRGDVREPRQEPPAGADRGLIPEGPAVGSRLAPRTPKAQNPPRATVSSSIPSPRDFKENRCELQSRGSLIPVTGGFSSSRSACSSSLHFLPLRRRPAPSKESSQT